ncbi:hypothetical protein NFI96_003898 [Prochilodus magdalenae]|nr:hypothetical protein NFI96_003898 [Prochilodus magdalenae]
MRLGALEAPTGSRKAKKINFAVEVPCLNLEMSGRQKSAAHSAAKMGLRSGDFNQNGEGEDEASPSAEKTGNVADDIASIFAILKQISGELQSLKEIRKATTSMEGKLSALMDRISDVEGRLGFLEESDKKLQANPPARQDELEGLKEKLVDMEDRHRRNNLRFIGIPEGSEQDDMLSYLRKILSQLLGIASPPDGWDIERAHRALAPAPTVYRAGQRYGLTSCERKESASLGRQSYHGVPGFLQGYTTQMSSLQGVKELQSAQQYKTRITKSASADISPNQYLGSDLYIKALLDVIMTY